MSSTKQIMSKEPVEIKLEEKEGALNEEQQQIVGQIYQTVKNATESILNNSDIDNTIKITQLIGKIAKIVEVVKVNDKKISGASKKAVTLEIGKLIIRDVIQDEDKKQSMLIIYDVLAEETLDVMIDVSHVVNTKVKEATHSCFKWLFSLCSK